MPYQHTGTPSSIHSDAVDADDAEDADDADADDADDDDGAARMKNPVAAVYAISNTRSGSLPECPNTV